MADLKDPVLPPGAVVHWNDDGSAIRNDGKELKSRLTNPWYVLMTIYGEQDGDEIDEELAEKNRKAWNAWAGRGMTAEEREKWSASSRIAPEELAAWEALEKDVTKRFKARFEGDRDLPDPNGPIDLSEIAFFNTVVLKNAIFHAEVSFNSATFTQDARFNSATFTQAAVFHYATFTQDAVFDSATFTRDAWFRSATFTQAARFTSATFTQAAVFDSATFTQAAVFHYATFTQAAQFHYATFTQAAVFYSATFTQAAWFTSATFTQDAWFRSATFMGPAKFPLCRFEGAARFVDATFEKPGNFRDAQFVNSFPVFDGAVLHPTMTFMAEQSGEIESEEDGEKKTVAVQFWPATRDILRNPKATDPDRPLKDARDSCAIIRHAIAQQGAPEREHFFFRREMALNARIGTIPERLPYMLYQAVSKFGYSIGRPAIALAFIATLFALAYTVYFAFSAVGAGETPAPLTGIAYSASNTLPFLGFNRLYFDPADVRAFHPFIQFLAAAQTVLSFILLFFLGLGLRNRFRLR